MFFTQFEIKAFKNLKKTDKYLLVILKFINVATYITNSILFNIYYLFFTFTVQATYSNSSHTFQMPVAMMGPSSEILNAFSQCPPFHSVV